MREGAAVLLDRTYTHDDLGRLTQVEEVAGAATRTLAYGYDDAGAIISRTDSSDPGAATFYEYDAFEHIVAVRRGSVSATPAVRYDYDSHGLRIRERGPAIDPVDAWWIDGTLLEERRPAVGTTPGDLVARYHEGPFGLLRVCLLYTSPSPRDS